MKHNLIGLKLSTRDHVRYLGFNEISLSIDEDNQQVIVWYQDQNIGNLEEVVGMDLDDFFCKVSVRDEGE